MARKGLPKSYIKKWGITKKAWREYHAAQARKAKHIGYSKSRTTKSKTTRRKSNPKRRVKRTGRKKRRRGGKSLQRTIFKWLRIAALIGPGAYQAVKWPKMEDKVRQVLLRYTGYDTYTGEFAVKYLAEGYGPFLMATLATYGIPKIAGIIRRL